MSKTSSILIIYTGGTIGMINHHHTGSLTPFNFDQIEEEVPELRKFGCKLSTITFDPIIDSSNVNTDTWVKLVKTIQQHYNKFDGFVILHGTDTMAYSASALSFMLENLNKPVIFTGSQLPIGTIRTDGKENLVTAIEIATAQKNGQALVPEVCIYFENKLFRGNRTTKHNSEHFNAFSSSNYPPLAEVGIHIRYNYTNIHYHTEIRNLEIYTEMDTNVGILKIFPGISKSFVEAVLSTKGLKALVLETFGSGNAPTGKWFTELLTNAVAMGMIIVNITQCSKGSVEMGRYETSLGLLNAGVISGYDMTTEAAITKLMFLLGRKLKQKEIVDYLKKSVSGEIYF